MKEIFRTFFWYSGVYYRIKVACQVRHNVYSELKGGINDVGDEEVHRIGFLGRLCL